MLKYSKSKLWPGEMSELLHGVLHVYKHGTIPWFTKDRVLFTIKEKWKFAMFHIRVSKIIWNSESNWTKTDNVDCEKVLFNIYNPKDLDELVGYLFQASIDGYTIRYVSTDNFTGIYLEKSNDNSTNIDEDVLTALVDAVEKAIEDRKPKDD